MLLLGCKVCSLLLVLVIRRQGQGDGPPLHLECARVDLEEGPEVLRRAVGELLPARLEIPGEPRQEVSQRGGSGGELGADALGQEGVVLGRCCCPSSCCCCCCRFIAPFREDLGDGSPELLEVNGLALLVDDKVIRVVEEEVSELLHVLAGDVADLGRGLGAVTEQTLEGRRAGEMVHNLQEGHFPPSSPLWVPRWIHRIGGVCSGGKNKT